MAPAGWDLSGKVALVTGASRGIGAAAALALAGAGCDLVLASRDKAALEQVGGRIQAVGRRALVHPIDLQRLDAIPALFEHAVQEFARLDILINNAGTNIRRPVVEFTEADWDTVVNLNLRAAFFCAQAAGRIMVPQRSGKVVTISSIAGRVGLPTGAIYAATKAGVSAFTRTLAVEWAPHNVQVNAIGPGYIRTKLTEPLFASPEWVERVTRRIPMARTGEVGDLIGTVLFLSSPASDYMTGQTLFLDGGWTIT
ncbi:MAG: glucose 1-dehydrogenase [Candidatus Rokubacteria bacterium]|nr:glucose 1-dehydrogenase [Candidatus Rokubacteria bacterium]